MFTVLRGEPAEE